MKETYRNAGYREREIIKSGTKKVVFEDGHRILIFETETRIAIYDETEKMWIA